MICSVATKTTGLKQGSHEVIEVTFKPFGTDEVTYRVKPERLDIYDETAQKMNGISAASAAAFPDKNATAEAILRVFHDITPVGHYFKFDYDMLRNTFGDKFIVELFGHNRPIDTAILAEEADVRRLENGQTKLFASRALNKICSVLEINEPTKAGKIEQLYRRLVD